MLSLIAQTGPVGQQAFKAGTDNTLLLKWVLIFGTAILVVAAIVQVLSGRGFVSSNFTRVYGLAFIATLGTTLAFADVGDGARTGAYTVLGTIAGYLVSTRPIPAPGVKEQDETNGGKSPPEEDADAAVI